MPHIALSSGSACTSGTIERSHVLSSMKLDDVRIDGSFRISAGRNTTNGLSPETLKKYRYNRGGVRAISKKTGIEIFGALDDLWLNKDTEEIVVLDYKATSTKNLEDYTTSKKHYHVSYRNS